MNADTQESRLHNPYVGPAPLAEGQPLYGREREVEELCDLVVSKRVVLLFAPSGAGKTSLLRAGLIPALRRYRLRPLPVARLGYHNPDVRDASVNRYTLAMLRALESREDCQPLGDSELSQYTLCSYFRQRLGAANADGKSGHWLVVIDQLEELFTVDPVDGAAKRAFLEDLGRLLSGADEDEDEAGDDRPTAPAVWAVFSMREDRVGELFPYLDLLPTGLAFRYRIDCLREQEAFEAIVEPSQGMFSMDAARKLVEDLRTISCADGTQVAGRFVEPVQLQVVCRELWKKVVDGQNRQIMTADVADASSSEVEFALQKYYDSEVEAAASATGTSSRKLREWIGNNLVTASGFRTQVLREQAGELDAALEKLIEAHLVRPDTRNDREWIELTHDRLVAPIHAANEAWYLDKLMHFQMRARQYQQSGFNNKALLVTGADLRQAREYASYNPGEVTPAEQRFIDDSTRRRARHWALLAAGTLAALVVLAGGAWTNTRNAFRTARYQDVRMAQLASPTAAAGELLGVRAEVAGFRGDEQLRRHVDRALLETMARIPASMAGVLKPREHVVWSVQFTPDGEYLLAGSWDGRLSMQRARTGAQEFVSDNQDTVHYDIALHAPSGLLAATRRDGAVTLWKRRGDGLTQVGTIPAEPRPVVSAAFTRDGRILAVGGQAGTVKLWDVSRPQAPRALAATDKPGMEGGSEASFVQKVLFVPQPGNGPELMAVVHFGGLVRLWTLEGGVRPVRRPEPDLDVSRHVSRGTFLISATPDPSGRYLVVGDADGYLHIWDLQAPDREHVGVRLGAASHAQGVGKSHVKSIAFDEDPRQFVSVGLDGYVLRWTLPAQDPGSLAELDRQTTAKRYGHMGERLFSVAQRPGHPGMVAIGGTRSIWLLDLQRGSGPVLSKPLAQNASLATGWLSASTDTAGNTLVAEDANGHLHFWHRGDEGFVRTATWRVAETPSGTADPFRIEYAVSPKGDSIVTFDCEHLTPVGTRLRNGLPDAATAPSAARHGCTTAGPVLDADGTLLATANGATLRVWRRNGDAWQRVHESKVQPLRGARARETITSLAVRKPDNGSFQLASGMDSGHTTLITFRIDRRGALTETARSQVDAGRDVLAIAFGPGNTLLTGGEDGFLRTWSTSALKAPPKERSPRHERSITSIVIAHPASARKGDDIFMTADKEGNVLRWASGGRSITTLAPASGQAVESIATSADGSMVITAGSELLAWDLSDETIKATASNVSPPSAEAGRTGLPAVWNRLWTSLTSR